MTPSMTEAERQFAKMYDEEAIYRLAARDATVNAALTFYRHGGCSWTTMLVWLVATLAEANERLVNEMADRLRREPGPIIVEAHSRPTPPML